MILEYPLLTVFEGFALTRDDRHQSLEGAPHDRKVQDRGLGRNDVAGTSNSASQRLGSAGRSSRAVRRRRLTYRARPSCCPSTVSPAEGQQHASRREIRNAGRNASVLVTYVSDTVISRRLTPGLQAPSGEQDEGVLEIRRIESAATGQPAGSITSGCSRREAMG